MNELNTSDVVAERNNMESRLLSLSKWSHILTISTYLLHTFDNIMSLQSPDIAFL